MCQFANRVLGFCSHVCSVIDDERLRACFRLVSYWLPRLMQAIPGGIKAQVILISNEMPGENTNQNTTQPPHRLTTCFSVISNLRTTVPFVTAHLEIFHCTHHPVIPKSALYFTFCSTLNALSKRTSE